MKLLTTITLLATALCSFAQLSGTYTIDNSQLTKKTNFSSITEAVMTLKMEGTSGDVTFQLKDGDYYEPIVLEQVNPEAIHNIKFEGQEGQKNVKFINEGIGLMVSNSHNISFDNIDFESRTAIYSSVVIINNSNNVELLNGSVATIEQSAKDQYLVALTNTSKNNRFEGNKIEGDKGFLIQKASHNNTVQSNQINTSSLAVEIHSSQETAITNNAISQSDLAFLLDGYTGSIDIEGNNIDNVNQVLGQTLTYRPSAFKVTGSISNNVINCNSDAFVFTNNVENLEIANNTIAIENGEIIKINEIIEASIYNVTSITNDVVAFNEE